MCEVEKGGEEDIGRAHAAQSYDGSGRCHDQTETKVMMETSIKCIHGGRGALLMSFPAILTLSGQIPLLDPLGSIRGSTLQPWQLMATSNWPSLSSFAPSHGGCLSILIRRGGRSRRMQAHHVLACWRDQGSRAVLVSLFAPLPYGQERFLLLIEPAKIQRDQLEDQAKRT